MYVKKAVEDDTKMAEGWKEEAEKVFLFVSVYLPCRISPPFKGYRPVYLLLSLRLLSRCQF